jgi:hypothetical protein
MEQNKYIEAVELLLKENKVVCITETDGKGRIGGHKIISNYEQGRIIKFLVNQEINKIPKWIRKLYRVNTLHLQ